MFNLIPIKYKILASIAFLAIFGCSCYFAGWSGQHDKLVEYTAKVKQVGDIQAKQVAILNKKVEDNANESSKNIDIATKSITDYYKLHPVVRLRDTKDRVCSTEAAGDSSAAYGEAADVYASPYRPDDTEEIAARLYELQLLLEKDGVEVK